MAISFWACVADLSPRDVPPELRGAPEAVAESGTAESPILLMALAQAPAPETRWNGAFRFRAGQVTVQADIVWVATRRLIVVQPFAALRSDLQWTLESGDTTVLTRDGREVRLAEAGYPLTRATALSAVPDPRPTVAPSAESVAAILRFRCGSCHNNDGMLTPLDTESLFARSQHAAGLPLVKPFRPEASVLLHRIVTDYPLDGVQQRMPPPWSTVPPMSDEEVRQIEAWIMLGAPR